MINKTTIREVTIKEKSAETGILVNGIHLPYRVDDAYFECFSQTMIEIVSSLESNKQPNYKIPNNYFEGLADSILSRIKEEDNVNEFIETSKLHSLSKENMYSLPQGYFENFNITLNESTTIKSEITQGGKVISMNNYKKWMNIAVAASILGVIIASAILFSTKSNNSDRYLSYKSVDVTGSVKKLSDDELVKYLNTDVEAGSVDMTIIDDGAEPDVDQRIKAVSDFDLDQYLQESATSNVKKGI